MNLDDIQAGTEMLSYSPLHKNHVQLGARMVEFAGWMMPVQYTSIIQEHAAVRNKAGLFDLSHMGEIWVSGNDAVTFLQKVTTNDLSKLKPGDVQYNLFCYPDGGIVDDLLVYCFADKYLLVVNASNTRKDYLWLEEHLYGDVKLQDASATTTLLAVQGPQAQAILQKLTKIDLETIRYYNFTDAEAAGISAILSRTGYTGEDGFELYIKANEAEKLWQSILEAGRDEGIQPIGLGARDILRLEAAYSLYGQEITAQTTPLDAGLQWAVKLQKGDFIGRESLVAQKESGIRRKLVGLEMLDKGIPRTNYPVFHNGVQVGHITSGTLAPATEKYIALAYLPLELAILNNQVNIMIRNKAYKAKIIPKPFIELRVKKN